MYVRAFSRISRGKSAMISLLFVAVHSQEKEKPAKFANGSLLGNDSRIFAQHYSAYPLSRMRPFSSNSSYSFFLLVVALLPPISLFQSSTVPRRPGVLYPFTFYFALSRIFGASLPAMMLCTLDFVCILDFPSLTYYLGFCDNNVTTTPITVSLYTRLCQFFFFFFFLVIYVISVSSIFHNFATCPFSVHHGVLYIPVGNCPSFLASPTFIARAARRYDCPNKAIRTIPFFFPLVPLVGMSPTFLPCITVDFAALTSFASESSLFARDLYLVRFASFGSGVRPLRDAATTLSFPPMRSCPTLFF